MFVHLTLQGILQTVKLESNIAQPLCLAMLNKMVLHVDFDHPIQVVAWVAIVIGFHLLLYKSNLVPNSVAEFKAAQQLQCRDIHFHCGMDLVKHKAHKTTMPLLKGKCPFCPVSALKKLFLFVLASPSDPLFAFHRTKAYSQSRLSVLTYSSLMLYLRCWLEWAGYKPYRYSCHSLHRGRHPMLLPKTHWWTRLNILETGGVNATSNTSRMTLPLGSLHQVAPYYNFYVNVQLPQ